jgi:prophage regulatory protein
MQAQTNNLTGFIRERQLRPGIVPVAHSTLWNWVKAGKFPAPVTLSERVTAWRCSDVQAWVDAQGGSA